MFFSYIKACSYYLPEKVITNDELAKTLDTSHEWIVSRTGINQRHIAGAHETSAFMAAECAKKVIGKEGVDLIIVATCTADYIMPSTASLVQSALGLNCAAFDVQGACAGFIYALSIGDQFIKTGMYERVLVIGVEKMSKVLDWTDRGTCVLFGDGAGAILLERSSDEKSKIIDFNLFSDGAKKDLVYVDGVLKMRGTELFRQAVDKLGACVEAMLTKHNLSANDIDWFIPHQANLRIIQFLSERFKIPMEKMIINIDECANTSAASIPIALGRAYEKGQIKRGQKILLEAIGSGLVWGSVLLDF